MKKLKDDPEYVAKEMAEFTEEEKKQFEYEKVEFERNAKYEAEEAERKIKLENYEKRQILLKKLNDDPEYVAKEIAKFSEEEKDQFEYEKAQLERNAKRKESFTKMGLKPEQGAFFTNFAENMLKKIKADSTKITLADFYKNFLKKTGVTEE